MLYQKLQNLSISLQPLQEAAEGAAPHLLDHVARSVGKLRERIQKSFTGNLEKTIGTMGWPRADIMVPPDLQQEWNVGVERLLDLQ